MSKQRRTAGAAGSKARVQGVATEQTVKASAGVLHTVIIANNNAAVQTLTLTDGATAQIVLQVPAKDTRSVAFGVQFATSIKATPSSADIDALFVYD
jgi:hypothetical protein